MATLFLTKELSGMKVREVIKLLERDGWVQVRMRGSHRQLKHPYKTDTITVAGKLGVDMPRGTLLAVIKKAGIPKEN